MSGYLVAPSRGRGLKQVQAVDIFDNYGGRPFTGAWIETVKASFRVDNVSRPFTGAWIETHIDHNERRYGASPLHGGVD